MVRGTAAQGLTARGRVMLVPLTQVIDFTHPNRYHCISLQHLSGPLQGVEILFEVAYARKARTQVNCHCDAYHYPHNKGKGQCLK